MSGDMLAVIAFGGLGCTICGCAWCAMRYFWKRDAYYFALSALSFWPGVLFLSMARTHYERYVGGGGC